jgi:phosphopantothenoylcysteine decarboxylase
VTGPPPPGRPVSDRRVLYVVACAAPPAADVGQLVSLAQRRGWDVCVLTTPSGRRFTDTAALERQTGHPVRSEYKNPGEPDVLPDPDAVIVAPATVNTVNKWAAGICDTLALGILVEAIGKRLPIVALPSSNQAHAAHPAFAENIGKLRSWGVSVLFGPGMHGHGEPGTDKNGPDQFPWSATLDALGVARDSRADTAAG